MFFSYNPKQVDPEPDILATRHPLVKFKLFIKFFILGKFFIALFLNHYPLISKILLKYFFRSISEH